MRISSPRPLCRTKRRSPRLPLVLQSCLVTGALLFAMQLGVPAGANAASRGSLTVAMTGLPSGQRPLVVVRGHGFVA